MPVVLTSAPRAAVPFTVYVDTLLTAPPTVALPFTDSELPSPATVLVVFTAVPLSVVEPSSVTALP